MISVPNAWIKLDLDILRNNIRKIQSSLSQDTQLIFVVKSNAYGHGMETVAKCAWECGICWFAVAHANEAITLRKLLPDAHIIILGVLQPDEAETAVKENFVPFVVSAEHAETLAAELQKGQMLHCHAEIDTGMGRLGILWNKAPETIDALSRIPGLSIDGICSHLASSDEKNKQFSKIQAERFQKTVNLCQQKKFGDLMLHISNSGGIRTSSDWDMKGVRAGIMLYGYPYLTQAEFSNDERSLNLKPFLQWKTRVLQVKDVPQGFPVSYGSTYITRKPTRIATIDVGYADGYSRKLSNRGQVIINGKRFPVAGRVTMNLTTIDIGADNPAKPGDIVTLLGEQSGESIWADEIAEWSETISYEVLTSIRSRLL